MRAFTSIFFLATFLATTTAQQTYAINPKNVPLSLRQYWCQSQKTQCPLICLQTSAHSEVTEQNKCNADILTYACVCSNGQSPNVTQYSQTLPYFICTEWGNECVHNCGNDASCQSDCRQNHPCGAQDPAPPNKTIIAASKSASKASAAHTNKNGQTVYNGFAGGASASASQTGQGAAGHIEMPLLSMLGHTGGQAVVIAGLLFGFALIL